MTVTVRLPRVLSQVITSGTRHLADGDTVAEVLDSLFRDEPALKYHLLDETGRLRRHVLVFVDAGRADLDTLVQPGAEVRVIQAVSGG